MLHLWKLIDDYDKSDFIIVPISHTACNMLDENGKMTAYSAIAPYLKNKSLDYFRGLVIETADYAKQLQPVDVDFEDINNSDVLLFKNFIPEDLMNFMNSRIDDRYEEIMSRENKICRVSF